MTRLPARRLSIALTSVLLLAQLILAWHMPSHLNDHQPHVFASSLADESLQNNEPCELGINGHGVGLTSVAQGACTCTSGQPPSFHSQTAYRSLHHTGYQARGPPLHS